MYTLNEICNLDSLKAANTFKGRKHEPYCAIVGNVPLSDALKNQQRKPDNGAAISRIFLSLVVSFVY